MDEASGWISPPAPGVALIFRLIILNGPRKGERVTVPVEPMTIGRGEGCVLRIDDAEMAAEHAIIEHHEGGLLVRDLGSMSRTLVNKREVQRAVLHHGDMIEIGLTSLLVQAFVQADITGVVGAAARRKGRRGALAAGIVAATGLAVWAWVGRDRGGPSLATGAPDDAPAATTAEVATVVSPAPGGVSKPLPPPVALPVATTNRPAPVENAGASEARTAAELRHLRAELATIKSAFATLATQQVRLAAAPPSAVVPPAPVRTPPTPTRAELSDRMLQSAKARQAAGRLDEADEMLAKLQAEDPGHLPAYPARAAMFEKRGMPDKAIGQWALLLQRAAGTPEAERAAGEWARLTWEQRRRAAAPAGRIRIRDLALRRFPDSEDYDDMRLVRITLEIVGPAPAPAPVRVEVAFFDQDSGAGTPTLSRAMMPRVEAQLAGPWQPDRTLAASAAYVVPAGFRAANRCSFHGYIVRVYAGGELQDEAARPMDLLAQPAATAGRATP